MFVRDLFREAFRTLGERPGRSVLTALGSLLGVATVVAISGLSATAVHQVSLRFDEILSTRILVEPASPLDPEPVFGADLRAVESINGVTNVARYSTLPQELATTHPVNGREISIAPVAVSREFAAALGVEVVTGTMWDAAWTSHPDAPVVLIGQTVALELNIGVFDGPFTLWVQGQPVTVVGVVRAGAVEGRLNSWVLVPEATAAFWGPISGSTILVRVLPGAGTGVAAVLPFVLDAESPHSFVALAPPEPETLRANIEGDTRAAFLVAGGIALLAGAVAITSATLTSVVERTEQFGIRRAFGAHRRDIARLVVLETTALGAVGGMAGCLLGLALVLGFSLVLGWAPVFDPRLVPMAVSVGIMVGALAGLIPGFKAATIEPVEALRRT